MKCSLWESEKKVKQEKEFKKERVRETKMMGT